MSRLNAASANHSYQTGNDAVGISELVRTESIVQCGIFIREMPLFSALDKSARFQNLL